MKKTLMIGMLAALLTTSAGAALANGFEVRANIGNGDAYCALSDLSVGTWYGTDHVRFVDRDYRGMREDRRFGDRRFDERRGDQRDPKVAWRGDHDGGSRSDDRNGGPMHESRRPVPMSDHRW